MQAAIFGAPFDLKLLEREKPEPKKGEALIRVDATGLCAGDLYIYLGKNPYVTYPRIGGHEIAGRVEKLGPDTVGPKLGTAVVVDPFIECGSCYPCRIGKANCCANLQVIGVHREGGFADFIAVPVDHLVQIPTGLSAYHASFAEPVAIGVQACRRGHVSEQDTVLVLGAGPIGLALAEVAKARGAKVFITDISQERLATSAELGAIPLAAGDTLLDQVMGLTHGEGMPVVIEATGNINAIEQTAELVAAGGRIVIVGLVKKGTAISFEGLDITRKEMTIIGSRASTGCLPESLDLLASGKIRYPNFGSKLNLTDAPSIFAELAQNPSAFHKGVFMSTYI